MDRQARPCDAGVVVRVAKRRNDLLDLRGGDLRSEGDLRRRQCALARTQQDVDDSVRDAPLTAGVFDALRIHGRLQV